MLIRQLSQGEARRPNERFGKTCGLGKAESVPVQIVGKRFSDGFILVFAACVLEVEAGLDSIFETHRLV